MEGHHHPTVSIGAPLLAAVGFFQLGVKHLADSGLTWQTAVALLAALGSFLIGIASVSREVRGWYFGRPVKDPS